ncbi:hypothetical protein SAMN04489842_2347 [Natronobacterium texcoconense]|uniref:Uncharacterized protein n=1 Tax=Natronobacterium texcoconense TaxID=1095778 RepID=A0A1H1GB12_NATTX|nr:hypothetical protein SAMN04489842_2347 [Natronobacterium texcoconense]
MRWSAFQSYHDGIGYESASIESGRDDGRGDDHVDEVMVG